MSGRRTFTLVEICALSGVEECRVTAWIERRWIVPAEDALLDEEDLARIRLIEDLQRDFGVNDDAIPVILHLVDQLCLVQEALRRRAPDAA